METAGRGSGFDPHDARLGGALSQVAALDCRRHQFRDRCPEYDVMRARFDRAFNAYIDSGELRKLGKRLNVQVP